MRAAEILRPGAADRATLSRENHPLSFLPSFLLPDPRTPPFSLPISLPRAFSPLATDYVLCLALALAPFALLRFPLSSR